MRPVTNEDLAKDLADLKTGVASLTRHITGGHEPEKGLIVRLDRVERAIDPKLPERVKTLEDAEKRRVWWARAAIGSAIGALVTSFWHLLRGKIGS
jgi:hypothetical protein